MIRRAQRRELLALLSILLFDNFLLYAHALTDFDCHISVNDAKFDLTSLAGEHVINWTRSTPPTTVVDSLRFDLCADLKAIEGLAEFDQCTDVNAFKCSSGTRACLTEVNQKDKEPDRITAVIPIVQTSNLDLNPSVSRDPKALCVQLHGSTYSGSTTRQSLNLTLLCDPDKTSTPEFVAYNGTRLDVVWHAPAGCAFQESPPKEDNGDKEGRPVPPQKGSVGSGIGWFFLVILLALLAYFGLGAYYNYSTYGASGSDLIPHRDFWREVPYMLTDVISHLCSSARPRRASRGGYIAV